MMDPIYGIKVEIPTNVLILKRTFWFKYISERTHFEEKFLEKELGSVKGYVIDHVVTVDEALRQVTFEKESLNG